MPRPVQFAPLAVALAIVLCAGGCKRGEPTDASQPADTAATTPGAQTPPPEATQPPASATGSSGTNAGTPPSATEPGMPTPPNGYDIGVAKSADHGEYLVDGTGKTVYMLARDSSTTSTCQGPCTTEWPPLLAQGEPKTMDPALSDGDVGVIQRGDGTQQVTFAGHPLYHYAKDTAAGQLNGAGKHDAYGDWSLLSPEGQPLGAR
ncbi:MAG: hypothetical protein ACTHKZ_07475 [Lysobacteraceae bacterium]